MFPNLKDAIVCGTKQEHWVSPFAHIWSSKIALLVFGDWYCVLMCGEVADDISSFPSVATG